MKEFRKILIAGAVLLGLALFVSYQRKKDYEDSVAEEEAKKLVQMDMEDVSKIRVENEKGTITFVRREKENGKFQDEFDFLRTEFDSNPEWRIVEPFQGLPDFYQVNNLVNTLKEFKETKVVDTKGERLSEYGLKEDPARVDFYKKADAEEPDFTLLIGDENSAATGLYAKTSADSEIVLANFTLKYLTDRSLSEWRKKEIIGIKELNEVQELDLVYSTSASERVLKLEKDKAKWQFVEPRKAPADFKAVEDFLSEIKSLRANEIVSDNAEKDAKTYGFEDPYLTIRFEVIEEGERVEKALQMGSKIEENKDVYVKRGRLPQIFSVRPGMKKSLTTNFEELLAKNPFTARRSQLQRLTMRLEDETFEFIQKEGRFYLKKPVEDQADPEAFAKLFDGLHQLKGSEYVEKVPSGKAAGKIQVETEDETQTLMLVRAKGKTFGTIEESDLSFAFDGEKIGELVQKAEHTRERRLLPMHKSNLAALSLQTDDGTVTFKNREDGGWALESTDVKEADFEKKLRDADMVSKLVDAVTTLRASRFLNETEPKDVTLRIRYEPNEGNPVEWTFGALHEDVTAYSKQRNVTVAVAKEKLKEILEVFESKEKEES